MASYHRIAAWQLQALCRSLGQDDAYPDYLQLQQFLMEPWGQRPVPERAPYPSSIGDDHSPYEFSVAFDPHAAALRLLLETQSDRPGLVANQRAALALTQRLADRYGVNLRRFEQVSPLLCPQLPQGTFSLWHAVTFGDKPEFKIYCNPQVQGVERAPRLIAEVLERLGFARAARLLIERAGWRGPRRDELKYFSLDLSAEANARVKIYFCHHDILAEELERTFAIAPSHVAGDVVDYCRTMVGHTGPFSKKPLSSCFSFVAGSDEPLSVTLHLPMAHYAPGDAEIASRVAKFIATHQLAGTAYANLLAAFVARPLPHSVGAQSYASYRRDHGSMRLTVYLSPELFSKAANGYSTAEAR